MTYEEAYRRLYEYGEKRPFLREEFELNELCKEAVRKQLPAIPRLIGDDEAENNGYSFHLCCPVCGKPIVNMWNFSEYKPKYCHYCGQKLAWSK